MYFKGINYDTGFISAGTTTREPFDPQVVKREMQIIHDDLHCNAVRITGGYPDRLEIAAQYAAEAGLEVWFCPFTNNLTSDELLELLADCANRAERLRQGGAEIVFLTGSELSLMTAGIIPGDTLEDRAAALAEPQRLRPLIPEIRARMKELLGKAVEAVRARFHGKLSYASVPLDGVDWGPFDIISTDAGYRVAAVAGRFREDIRAFVAQGRAQGKPVAITEFGCAAFRGAADNAGRGISDVIEWDANARPVRLKGEYVRDEDEQAQYITELLDVFSTEGVDSAFVYTFARYDLANRTGSHVDFDMASFGLVKVLDDRRRGQRYPDMPWEPKAAFTALADCYAALDR
ncbi:MAG TPA: hypothetical protein VIC54_03675 [Terriglobales bacterium]|jgi:hypothetical protein